MLLPQKYLTRRAHPYLIKGLQLIVALLCGTLSNIECYAGNFSVTPTRIELSDKHSRAVIQINNPTDEPVSLQLRLLAWSQIDGKDQLQSTRDILATPQIVTIKARATQLVRVGALRKADLKSELAYRLFLEEIPAPMPPDFKGLQVLLKVSVPVFLLPINPKPEKFEASLSAIEPNLVSLRIVNLGNVSVHLRDISLHPADSPESTLATSHGSLYVLPNQQGSIVFNATKLDSGKKFLIKATTPSGSVQFDATTNR